MDGWIRTFVGARCSLGAGVFHVLMCLCVLRGSSCVLSPMLDSVFYCTAVTVPVGDRNTVASIPQTDEKTYVVYFRCRTFPLNSLIKISKAVLTLANEVHTVLQF